MLFIPSRRIWWNSICLDISQTCASLLYVCRKWNDTEAKGAPLPPSWLPIYFPVRVQVLPLFSSRFFTQLCFFLSSRYSFFASREGSGVWERRTDQTSEAKIWHTEQKIWDKTLILVGYFSSFIHSLRYISVSCGTYLLTYLLITYSMQQSSSWEANWFAAS